MWFFFFFFFLLLLFEDFFSAESGHDTARLPPLGRQRCQLVHARAGAFLPFSWQNRVSLGQLAVKEVVSTAELRCHLKSHLLV